MSNSIATISHAPSPPAFASAPAFQPKQASPPTPASPLHDSDGANLQHHTEFIRLHKHCHIPPHSAHSPSGALTDIGTPTNFPHATHLLTCVLSALVHDKIQYVFKMYDMCFTVGIWNALLRACNDETGRSKLCAVSGPKSPKAPEFFDMEGGFPIAIASILEQPLSGDIVWGMTNDDCDRKEELGWLIPVLNAELCTEYERTFAEEDEIAASDSANQNTATEDHDPRLVEIRARRAQLGSLIGITFIHQGMHAYVRWRLGDSVEPSAFDTLKLEPGRREWELEHILFKGFLQVQMREEDAKRADRFRGIQDVWIQDHPTTVNTTGVPIPLPLRLIPNSHLKRFHAQLMQSVLPINTLIECFQRKSNSTPLQPRTVILQNDRVLLRVAPPSLSSEEHDIDTWMPMTLMPAPIPHCGLALQRADNYGPQRQPYSIAPLDACPTPPATPRTSAKLSQPDEILMLFHLEVDRARAADLDVQIVDLERALSALRSQRALVQERLESYKYPVLTLPNEIISEIFVHYIPVYPDCPPLAGILSPTTLTQICRRWREAAFATPELWRATKVLLGSGDPSAQLLVEWLPRSGCYPISLEIIEYDEEAEERSRILRFLTSHCARWEHLKMRFQSAVPGIAPSMPLLRHLEISVEDPDYYDSSPIIFGEAPLLRSAILDDVTALNVVLPWVQLTSLQLHRMFPRECVEVLQQTSNLVHCTLFNIIDDGYVGPWLQVTLLHLQSLSILDEYRPTSGYLNSFIVPALRELRIAEPLPEHPIAVLTSLMSTSGCKPQEIVISGDRRVSSDAYNAAFPSVKFVFTSAYYLGEGPDVGTDTESTETTLDKGSEGC
ncbi:hypothetical protein B0H16DRAFT_1888552 [Mycena metata]|uniref:CRIB domain-containing protein n=1 Tax=Mycena metata TaxID=1033252 RepID=A0AAD7IRZ8_9AGAR|nr:hypothetical protein B0H16DRAFT_1888552 [Mycena metata]